MKKFRKILVEQEQEAGITCNKCGRVVNYEEFEDQYEVDFTEVSHVYGYGSIKDGDRYLSHICEPCMDEFYASFKVKPEIWVAGDVFEGDDGQNPSPSDV